MKKRILFSRQHPSAGMAVSLRPVVSSDLGMIYDWMAGEFPNALPSKDVLVKGLQAFHRNISKSSLCQSFLCLVNNAPMFQVDVSSFILEGDAGLPSLPMKGDYRIYIPMAARDARLEKGISMYILQTCTEYFFRHKEIKRIIIELNEEEGKEIERAKLMGFRFLGKTASAFKQTHLYACTRQAFNPAA